MQQTKLQIDMEKVEDVQSPYSYESDLTKSINQHKS